MKTTSPDSGIVWVQKKFTRMNFYAYIISSCFYSYLQLHGYHNRKDLQYPPKQNTY